MKRIPVRVLIAAVVGQALASYAGPQQPGLADLIPAADVIVVAQISETDYSRTPADGPMTAQAAVLSVVKGRLRKGQSFRFSETAWVGPNYRAGEVRVLFLEAAGANSWRILSNLNAKPDFFIERDAIPLLNATTLKSFLERVRVPVPKSVLLTKAMLR